MTSIEIDVSSPRGRFLRPPGLLFAALALLLFAGAPAEAEPTQQRQTQLIRLVRHDCGSCHGMTLRGGLGPALTPERLAERSLLELQATILGGRPMQAMPPWAGLLSPAEARWIAGRLQDGFPRERP